MHFGERGPFPSNPERMDRRFFPFRSKRSTPSRGLRIGIGDRFGPMDQNFLPSGCNSSRGIYLHQPLTPWRRNRKFHRFSKTKIQTAVSRCNAPIPSGPLRKNWTRPWARDRTMPITKLFCHPRATKSTSEALSLRPELIAVLEHRRPMPKEKSQTPLWLSKTAREKVRSLLGTAGRC